MFPHVDSVSEVVLSRAEQTSLRELGLLLWLLGAHLRWGRDKGVNCESSSLILALITNLCSIRSCYLDNILAVKGRKTAPAIEHIEAGMLKTFTKPPELARRLKDSDPRQIGHIQRDMGIGQVRYSSHGLLQIY
ncbi:Hypothetical predicted protein [Podarcis lilfordi]|uniref:Uncharacterized protein n=1 Tax=Podarcis lilfordi TaxID=74358 RepID=A0AA35K657_9SAUR|nr:Hypothetical predicted protein [Podarcis lilfordi]